MPEAQGCMDVEGMEQVLKDVAEVGKRFTDAQTEFEKTQQAEIDAATAFDAARLRRKQAADGLKALWDEIQVKLAITRGARSRKDTAEPIMDGNWGGEDSYTGFDGEWDGGIQGAGYFLFEGEDDEPRRIPYLVRSGAQARETEQEEKEEAAELKRLREEAREHERPAKIQKVVQADVAQKGSDVAVPRIAASAAVARANSPLKARRQTARD
ncbi:hypothetical protein FA09DRAFT_326382 [Tilletiopsis washingtonensis]|uniref:Uncharacterized protein n=1 Tax=Tilletiopsis washingtonensis TaxID=58919 RepID=A0A316Z769_9BASI|nr:hypothetical protein FA09DRAFT_326382 [Tilletiopsis washingtonensis]PWN96013.1 hypothetical protein FA09DRAFT_326382 [Tilletiopsis washingtonensis]